MSSRNKPIVQLCAALYLMSCTTSLSETKDVELVQQITEAIGENLDATKGFSCRVTTRSIRTEYGPNVEPRKTIGMSVQVYRNWHQEVRFNLGHSGELRISHSNNAFDEEILVRDGKIRTLQLPKDGNSPTGSIAFDDSEGRTLISPSLDPRHIGLEPREVLPGMISDGNVRIAKMEKGMAKVVLQKEDGGTITLTCSPEHSFMPVRIVRRLPDGQIGSDAQLTYKPYETPQGHTVSLCSKALQRVSLDARTMVRLEIDDLNSQAWERSRQTETEVSEVKFVEQFDESMFTFPKAPSNAYIADLTMSLPTENRTASTKSQAGYVAEVEGFNWVPLMGVAVVVVFLVGLFALNPSKSKS